MTPKKCLLSYHGTKNQIEKNTSARAWQISLDLLEEKGIESRLRVVKTAAKQLRLQLDILNPPTFYRQQKKAMWEIWKGPLVKFVNQIKWLDEDILELIITSDFVSILFSICQPSVMQAVSMRACVNNRECVGIGARARLWLSEYILLLNKYIMTVKDTYKYIS